ncbi:hypothetical protein [Candidatus Nitrospira bockiana]
MECLFDGLGLFAVAVTTLLAVSTALFLGLLPHLMERRKRLERAAYFRTHLLHQFERLGPCLEPRHVPMPAEHQQVIDGVTALGLYGELLERDEWQSFLRTQSALAGARNQPSFNKREARAIERMVQDTASLLTRHLAAQPDGRAGWIRFLPPLGPRSSRALTHSVPLR